MVILYLLLKCEVYLLAGKDSEYLHLKILK